MGFLPRRILRRIFFGDYIDYVDGITASALVEIPILDQIRISDFLLYQRHPTVQLADGIAVSDRLFTSKQTIMRFGDRVSVADVLSYIRHPTVQFSDRISVGDLYVPSRRTVLLFGDSINFSDQLPSSKRSSVELRDHISVADWFFRLKKRLELRDTAIITDGVYIVPVGVKLFSDYISVGDALEISTYPVVVFADSVAVSDGLELLKSISPLFASLLYQKPRRRYLSLIISDGIPFADLVSPVRSTVVVFADTLAISDLLDRVTSRILTFNDYIYTSDEHISRNSKFELTDSADVEDHLSYRFIPVVVYVDSVAISDKLEPYKSISPLFASLLYQRPKRRYISLTIPDYIQLTDATSPVRFTVVVFTDVLSISDIFTKTASRVLTFGDYVHIPDDHISINPELRIRDSVDVVDHLSFRLIPVAIFTDSVAVSDRLEFYKSISPLLASLLQQRPRRRYLSLIISDIIPFADAVSPVKSAVVVFADTLTIGDMFDKVASRVLMFEDYIRASDEQVPKQAKIEIADLSDIEDYLNYRLVPVYVFGDVVHIADEIGYTKSISPLFASLLYQRPKRRYLSLVIYDGIALDDYVSARAGYVVQLGDSIPVGDSVSYAKSVSPLFVSLLSQRHKRRYRTLYLTDVISISDVFTPIRGYTVRFEDVILADVFEVRTTPTVLFSDFINAEDWIPNYPYVMYYGVYAVMAHRYLTFRDHIAVSDSLAVKPPTTVMFRDEIRFTDETTAHVNVKGVVFRDRIAVSDLTATNRS